MEKPTVGLTVLLHSDFETAQQRVTEALQKEGFGVLTEIDVKATLKKKMDVDFRPYKILGACNPPIAHQALTAVPEIGLFLPCNVTLSYVDEQITEVGIIDPMSMMGFMQNPALDPLAQDAAERLQRVKEALES